MHGLIAIITASAIADNTDGATIAKASNGKTFWGLTFSEWGRRVGSLVVKHSSRWRADLRVAPIRKLWHCDLVL